MYYALYNHSLGPESYLSTDSESDSSSLHLEEYLHVPGYVEEGPQEFRYSWEDAE